MAEICPQCSKKTGMGVGLSEANGRQMYECQLCHYKWKK